MHRQHRCAGRGDRRDTLFDRVVDVEQFHVKEHLLARRDQLLAKRKTVGAIKALIADLVILDGIAQRGDNLLGTRARRNVEPHDQMAGHGKIPSVADLGWGRISLTARQDEIAAPMPA
ncbi:hypothetical protein D3C87_1843690 [compost metagenome]